jgi:anti-sigma factor RsiW
MSRRFEIMGCDAVDERLEALVDDDLDPRERAAVENHLRRCPRCAGEHRLAVGLLAELRAFPRPDAPASVISGIHRAVGAEPGTGAFGGSHRASWRPPAMAAAAAVVMCAVLLGGWWQLNRNTATPSDAEIAAATREAKFALALIGAVTTDAAGDGVLNRRVLSPALKGIARPIGRRMATITAEHGPDNTQNYGKENER